MGQKVTKEETNQVYQASMESSNNVRRKKGKRHHSARINLDSINALQSFQNIDSVLSDMGVKTTLDDTSESGMKFMLFMFTNLLFLL